MKNTFLGTILLNFIREETVALCTFFGDFFIYIFMVLSSKVIV